MVSLPELLAAVDAAFVITANGLRRWDAPHPDRSPTEDEYSRLLDPAKWRIVAARAQAWLDALANLGLADVATPESVAWRVAPGTIATRLHVATPRVTGGIPLVVALNRIGLTDPADDAGVTLGAGDPASVVAMIPDCGCDACDSGSQMELDHLDERLLDIVTGNFRWMTDGTRTIATRGEGGWEASGSFRSDETEELLAADHPSGWQTVTGPSWLGGDHWDA